MLQEHRQTPAGRKTCELLTIGASLMRLERFNRVHNVLNHQFATKQGEISVKIHPQTHHTTLSDLLKSLGN